MECIHPKVCNICGGHVIYTSNSAIYNGREFGSGRCYLCTACGAYVGTHVPRPTEALGILADDEMRDMKMKCHKIFDEMWKNESTSRKRHRKRQESYKRMAVALHIPVRECHFGYFDMDMLQNAYEWLQSEAESEEV